MKKGRFSEEQIIGILKRHEAGQKVQIWRESTASARPRSTRGRASTAVWR